MLEKLIWNYRKQNLGQIWVLYQHLIYKKNSYFIQI